MKRFLNILLLTIILFSCKKTEKDSSTVNDLNKLQGFDYFLNTNEEWYYYRSKNSAEGYFESKYKALRDTTMKHEGDTIMAKIIREDFVSYEPGKPYSRSQEIIVYYNKEKRHLIRLDTNRERYDLGNFLFLEYDMGCQFPITQIDTVKAGKYYYKRFINSLNQIIIEGISLGYMDCQLFPPQPAYLPVTQVSKFRYTSNEFTFEWP